MSQTTIAGSSQSQPQLQTQPTDSRSREPFAKFDDRIAEVSQHVLPKQPYLITIPSDFPYRRHSTDPARWYLNTPFSRKEEQLQYMSLLLHQDDDETLLKVDGSRIDEDGHLLAHVPSPQSELPSRPQTPSENVPKKKISLKDYKTKDKSAVNTAVSTAVNTPERKPTDDIRKQAIKSHKEEVDAQRHEPISQPKAQVKQEHKPVIPKATVSQPHAESKPLAAATTRQDNDSQRPAKKRRLSDDHVTKVPETANGTKLKAELREKRGLPSLLSPEMPISGKTPKARGLPELLSPKLPQTLEKAAATVAPLQRSDEVRAFMKNLGSPPRYTEKKPDTSIKGSSPGRLRAERESSAKSALPSIKVASPTTKPASTVPVKSGVVLANSRTASPKPRQRHIIVLRYGKRNKKRVEMLLNLQPRQKKDVPRTAEKERPTSSKQPAKVEPPRTDRKRPADPTPEAPIKKPKFAASTLEPAAKIERPSTPKLESASKSPLQLTKPKSAFSTPKKEIKSIGMQRVASTDTTEARTPSQDTGRNSTPLAISHSSQPKTSPAPTSAPKTDDFTSWTELNSRIFQLGRILKKEGSKLAQDGDGKAKQQGVILLIEALLCFMLNSAAQAQARPNIDPGWSTILPYHIMVWKQSKPYRHLHGLVVQLGAVCRQHLHQEQIMRLAKETLPDDHIGSAPTPGSDGNTKGTDDNSKRQKSFLELRDELVQNSKELKVAWLESSRQLPYDVIEDQYTSTWARRAKDFAKRQREGLNPRELTKDFYLPLDVSTTVFEATNFALMFLKEWAMIEQVQWKTRIEL